MSNKSEANSANKDLFSKTHAVELVEEKKEDFPKGASIKLSHHRCHTSKKKKKKNKKNKNNETLQSTCGI